HVTVYAPVGRGPRATRSAFGRPGTPCAGPRETSTPDVLNTPTLDSDGSGSSVKVRVTTCGARCSVAPFSGSAWRSSAWALTRGPMASTPSAISARRADHLIVYGWTRTPCLDPRQERAL